MPFKFNPFTGTLDLVGGSSSAATDHHGGYSKIPSATSVTIVENKISYSFESLEIEGSLTIEGTLVILP